MRAAFDQDAAQDRARRAPPGSRPARSRRRAPGSPTISTPVGQLRPDPFGGDDKPPDAVRRSAPWRPATAARAGRARCGPGSVPRQRRTVSSGSSATAVPMPTSTASTSARSRCRCARPGRAVDVFGMAGHRRDPPVDRLADLADHDEVVDRPSAQRPEPVLPGLRQRAVRGSKIAWNFWTNRLRYRAALSGSSASVMSSCPAIASKRKMRMRNTNDLR